MTDISIDNVAIMMRFSPSERAYNSASSHVRYVLVCWGRTEQLSHGSREVSEIVIGSAHSKWSSDTIFSFAFTGGLEEL